MTHHLLGLAELAELLHVSPSRARRLADHDPEFPAPEATLQSGRVWSTEKVERWRDEHNHSPATRVPDRTDYEIHLVGFDQLERPAQVLVVRLEVETAAGIVTFERRLPVSAANRIRADLENGAVSRARADRSLRWALAHEAAAALGRAVERAGDIRAVPIVEELGKGDIAKITAAARLAASRRLEDIRLGAVLRVSGL